MTGTAPAVQAPLRVAVITLFPEMFASITDYGVSGRAVKQQRIEIQCWNPRDFTEDRHQTVDARPYGGGPGMVMLVEPLRRAVKAARAWAGEAAEVVYLSPQGKRFDQPAAQAFASSERNLILVAGRYEGVDERFIELDVDSEWSIGDYVLSGGELGAMVMLDAITRLLPGVLGHAQSAEQDSFTDGLLDCPHYTRPEVYPAGEEQHVVPDVLRSGDHERIRLWRLQQALGRTALRRPDLLEGKTLTEEQQRLLTDFRRDLEAKGSN
ncbi:tRNA (guanosine(37)-N1)-methyltransferase TrmD [Simiduia agarivorans]|uniref:tRNA (guanine-N(1)-)-methyltransferase n=1 Tax=Simiduia agarivorans (strain DSM 21679 / JCM 13881 / BCRC 17597 / SA1) TaxID=1117647 RepID=K4KFQ0_SIMAS|nr:tRNA (guanosine(37)-N1)-methyltransferase TrmD [Simiduia agarivorans]AFU97904.2 tRNA (guanine-N1)-methyltransferase [Simiduia agarivorans SA1 = DSM 21679]